MAQPFDRYHPGVTNDEIHIARTLRLTLLSDPYRPTYHFVCPEGMAMPFDPNGAVFWKGRHHLGYIYQHHGVHYWGHASSIDLLHWRHHGPMLQPTLDSPEQGIFSGNAFVDIGNKRVIALYHGVGAGNCIAFSDDDTLQRWHKQPGNPVVPEPADPQKADYQSWDPCGWIVGKTYYAVFGGPKNTVWKSKNLRKWTKCGPLLAKPYSGIDIHEDISCPDFFKLGNKWVMVCISHRLGARYYVGTWKNDQLHPEYHEMMTFSDNEYFAPESYTDAKGRRILFAWVFDGRNDMARNTSGWSGTMALPRVMTLASDNRLRMTPVDELATLRYNAQSWKNLAIAKGRETPLPVRTVEENVYELELTLRPGRTGQCGLKICCSPDRSEETRIVYDADNATLAIDTARTGPNQRRGKSIIGTARMSLEGAPIKLRTGQPLKLRIFVDRSIVEVFANDGQLALSRRIYPTPGSTGIKLFATAAPLKVPKVTAWDIMPTNPY